jgi:regulator of cell morphogenesis and NO signaling
MKLYDEDQRVNAAMGGEAHPTPSEPTAREQHSLRAIIERVVATHHVFTREAVAKIEALLPKALERDASAHSELRAIAKSAHALCDDLLPHLMREERVLFPWIEAAEAARDRGAVPPPAHFGTVKNPIRVMDHDHDVVKGLLHELRERTSEYSAPAWASAETAELYSTLRALDRDLVEHIHWESDVIFVRAASLEG